LADLRAVKDDIVREYLKGLNAKINDLRKYVDEVLTSRLNSRKIINQTFSNRLEAVEKKLERKK